jgi:hypothetical protein
MRTGQIVRSRSTGNYNPPTYVRETLDAFTIGEHIFNVRFLQPKEAPAIVVDEIIATNGGRAIRRVFNVL